VPLGRGGGQGGRGSGRGQGRGQGRSGSGAGSSQFGSILGSIFGGGQGRGRLRDPKTYLLLAAGSWALQWLERRFLTDKNAENTKPDSQPGPDEKGGL